MAGDGWREVALDDVATEITVGHVGPMASEYVAYGIPFLRSQNVEYLRINTDDIKFITPAFHERRCKSSLFPGDVVIVRTGKPGACNDRSTLQRAPTGIDKRIADLFPDSFEDSELGEIPKGWRVVPLPGAIEVNPTRSLRKGQVAPYLDMANMPTRGHVPHEVVDRPFGSGMRFVNGDTLVARITPCLENGKIAYVDFLEEGQVGWGSTEYIVLRPKPPLPEEFAYCLARSDGFREFAIQSMTGSSGRQRVPAESLAHYMLAAPPEQVAKRFGSFVRRLFARASAAAHQSRTLAALRDTLLPKLLSGEIRVKDTEHFVEAVL
ncbi:MAG: restriction endonuclease subunit S [Candidatus Binatia bacterium]